MTSATEFKGTTTHCWHGSDEDAASVYSVVEGYAIEICSTLREDGDSEVEAADAVFIADAFNVRLETGLTPRALSDRIKALEQACQKQNESICQTLSKALGYPRYCDDQVNFPGATEADGVCAGDHVAESLATAAAERIKVLEGANQRLREFAESYDERLQDQARETERIEERIACYDALELTRHEKMERLEGERAEILACLTKALVFGRDGNTGKVATIVCDLIAKLEGTQV